VARSKKYTEKLKQYDSQKIYTITEGLKLIKTLNFAKFDETVDLAFRLGVDPRHADQMIRGALVLPAGTGKTIKLVVIASGDKVKDAENAGADYFGGEELITKIAGGWFDFDRVIATPDMMAKAGKIARILGPRGLMPNPKLGTVVTDVTKAVKEQKMGKVEYRTDKTGIIHVSMGKKSFADDKLMENFKVIASAIIKAKPASSKGQYLKTLTVSTSMGLPIKLDVNEVVNLA
jgi:large subunit ribosomal protein L1